MTNRLLVLVFCFISSLNSEAQSWKKDLESSIEDLNKAIISRDNRILEKLTEKELSYGHSTGLVENKDAFTKNILSGPTKFFQIENADQTINLAGDMAIVRNICSIKGAKDSTPLDIKIGVLMMWKKEGAEWKLLARQGYKLP
jgi:ketosteroid isomerase-like protein